MIRKSVNPRFSASVLGRVLLNAPRPLILPAARLIVVFSPKAACTSVVIWFLHQLGHAKAAFEYNSWPHRYRNEVYYHSQIYLRSLAGDFSDFSIVRIVRNPFERAVSSYRHALNAGYADKLMSDLLSRPNIGVTGFSFSEFIDLLERIDLRTCNVHYRIQRHPIEDHLPVKHLVNITTQDLYTRLNEVEASLGLPHTNFTEFKWLHTAYGPKLPRRDSEVDVFTQPFTRQTARQGPWPLARAFLNDEARQRLSKLYTVDIANYLKQ